MLLGGADEAAHRILLMRLCVQVPELAEAPFRFGSASGEGADAADPAAQLEALRALLGALHAREAAEAAAQEAEQVHSACLRRAYPASALAAQLAVQTARWSGTNLSGRVQLLQLQYSAAHTCNGMRSRELLAGAAACRRAERPYDRECRGQ